MLASQKIKQAAEKLYLGEEGGRGCLQVDCACMTVCLIDMSVPFNDNFL